MAFNLYKNKYKLCRKLNIQFVINQQLSCNKEIFEKPMKPHNDTLKNSGFKENLVYTSKYISPVTLSIRNNEYTQDHMVRST